MKIPFSDFLPQPSEEREQERREQMRDVKVPLSDRFVMIGTAFVWLFLPAAAILIAFGLLALWLFGAL